MVHITLEHLMVFLLTVMIPMKVDFETVAGRLIISVDSRLLIDHHPTSTAEKVLRMVCMTQMQVLMATHRIILSVVSAAVAGVSSEVVAMIAMSIANARLLDDSQAHLEMHMVTPSTLSGTTLYPEITSGFSLVKFRRALSI
jgi:hypothetical protein